MAFGQSPDTIHPVSAGKLKQLWDAVRLAPSDQGDAPPPQTLPDAVAASPDPDAPQVDRMPSPAPQLPTPDPDVRLANADINAQPASSRVTDLQARVDQANAPRTVKQRLLSALPAAIGIGTAAIARGNSGAILGGVNQGEEVQREQRNLTRTNLTQQLAAAQAEREKEYDTAQRTVEQTNANRETNRTRRSLTDAIVAGRSDVAQTAANSRMGVADTNAGARRDVADTQTTARSADAIAAAASRERIAKIAAAARIQAGRYAADAAAGRQSRSFDHADTKPTADEDRRADLSKSLSDIGDHIAEVAARRPELFGSVKGRLTQLRQFTGTDDPDVADLKADREALGQIALGAHAMRNAGHIATAADSIVSGFTNSPEATISAIETAKRNAGTMQTIVRPRLTQQVAPGTAPARGGGKPPAPAQGKPDYVYVPGKGLVKQ